MFKEAEGPTALRVELVQALVLSQGVVEIETDDGGEGCCAGLVGVWNGKQGFVAMLVRQLEHPRIRRWVYAGALSELSEVMGAVDEGIEFVESLGFSLAGPVFSELNEAEKMQRIADWDDLRKLSRSPRAHRARDVSQSAEELAEDQRNNESGAVLGRLSLVRRREDAIDPLTRLLSYF